MSKTGIQFGRAAGNIDNPRLLATGKKREDPVRGLAGHALGSLGPGVHMAMLAGLIADLSYIDLNCSDLRSAQRW